MEYIIEQFEEWKESLENFQKNIKKDLEEIRQNKEAVRQLRNEIMNRVDKGQYIRDNNKIIISAPEIIIGNVDRNGILIGDGYVSHVTTRANNINLEGIGAGAYGIGKIVNRASSIYQIAVDPGIDGEESVVKETSEIVSQAQSVVINSNKNQDFFPNTPRGSANGIYIQSDSHINIDATLSCKEQESRLDNKKEELESRAKLIDKEIGNAKKEVSSTLDKMKDLIKDDSIIKDISAIRTNYLTIDEIHQEFERLTNSMYNIMNNYFYQLSKYAEVNRELNCIKDQKKEVGNIKSSFKDKSTQTSLSIRSEYIDLVSADGDGNLRTNKEARIDIAGKQINLTSYNEKGASMKDGQITLASEGVVIDTSNPKITDKNEDYPAEGKVHIISKDIQVEAVDYERKDQKKEKEEKKLTDKGSFRVRAENISLEATETEGKATGLIEANAKCIEIKSMDVDKEKHTDKSLASGSTMAIVAEKIFTGSKDKKVKSKSLQLASDEVGLFGDKTVELQQDGKAIVQLNGGDVALSGGSTELYGKTTIQGKTTFKSDVDAESVDMKNLKVKSSFKTPYTTEGMSVPGAPSTAKLSTKLKEEEMKKN